MVLLLMFRMDPYPPLLRSLSQYAPCLTVLDLRGNYGPGLDRAPSELRRFRGLKELSLRDFPGHMDEQYVEAVTKVLINSPEMETLRLMSWEDGPEWEYDPCRQKKDDCTYGILPRICQRFAERRAETLDENKVAKLRRLKLREVTIDHHSMNRFILDLPDPDAEPSEGLACYSGRAQKPLYLGKLTDLQYLERLHVEMIPGWDHLERLSLIRLPNFTPSIAPRLQSMTISPPCWEESYRWLDWALKNDLLEYAHQVSLGRLSILVNCSPGPANLTFNWTEPDGFEEFLSALACSLKKRNITESLQRLEIIGPGDWAKLIPSLKEGLSHLGKLKCFKCHLREYSPPLCLSWETLDRDGKLKKVADLAADFFEVQPSLQFVEVNNFLYQVIRWGPGLRDFQIVEILDPEREWVDPGDSPWQGPYKNAVPYRTLL